MDEQNIPIDINTGKLLEWLISRRQVGKDYVENIMKVREKINNAIQDMPAHEGIVKLLSGQHINYFHCLKIIDILKETEADTKNLFGRYGSQRMKDWQDILGSYQKDNVYLAEVAQMLIRNVSYEIPSLKKQLLKLESNQLECEKKLKDYSKAEQAALNEFNTICKQLGIEGKDIKRELVKLLDELPEIYEKVTQHIKTLEPTLNLYDAFFSFQLGNNPMDVMVLLKYLIQNGNTTTYEYIYGEKPIQIETPPLNITFDDEKMDENNETIDFGDDIDFGEENIQIETSNEGEIDWGSLTNTDDDFEIVDHVDLDINLEESGIVVEKSGLDGGIAKNDKALTILDNPKTQDQVLNDLIELRAFLIMRLYEMSSESNVLTMTQLDVPTILQMQTLETITALLDSVNAALNELTNKRVQHLHNVKHSAKYVDLLAGNLKQKLVLVQRMKDNKVLLEEKINEIREEMKKVQPVIVKTVQYTKWLQKEIEGDISKKYKGRTVNIVGSVNMV
nr:CDK5RAP3-like protein [Onthophagus taurus]